MKFFKSQSAKADALAGVPLFRSLPDAERQFLASHVDEHVYPEGARIAGQDEGGYELIMIVEGEAEVVRDGQVIAKLGPNDVVGEISVIDGKRRTADVTATTRVNALVMSSQEFRGVCEQSPNFSRQIMLALAERLRAADEKLAAI